MKRTNNEIITNKSILNQGQLVVGGNGVVMEGVAEGRRTQDVDALAIVRDLFERHVDLFHHFLYSTDMGTLLNFRLVSKAICELSMSLGGGLSPLMCRAFIAFSINQLMDELEKWAFARERTGIHVSEIDVSHLRNPGLLCDNIDFTKAQVSLGFQVKSNDELREFSELLLSDKLSQEQKWILGKIRELEFEKWTEYEQGHYDAVPVFRLPIDNNNIAKINSVLNYFGATERASQLTTLKFGDIQVKLTLPELPGLTALEFINVSAELELPNLQKLTRLRFIGGIHAALTLPELSNLERLEVGTLTAALTWTELSSLTALKFRFISIPCTLPELGSLVTLEYGDTFTHDVKVPTRPSLRMLSFGYVNGPLEIAEQPSLTTLDFAHINAQVTLSELRSLTTLSCERINAPLKLAELPCLTLFKLRDINIKDLNNPTQLCDNIDVTMAQMSIVFRVNSPHELQEFSELLLSTGLSEEQKLILGKIKELKFYDRNNGFDIDDENIAEINTVLGYFGSSERASQLETLSFGDIEAALTLPELPGLTTLKFGDINAEITLPMLRSLTTFSARHVNAEIWLPDLPNLHEFESVEDITPMLRYYG